MLLGHPLRPFESLLTQKSSSISLFSPSKHDDGTNAAAAAAASAASAATGIQGGNSLFNPLHSCGFGAFFQGRHCCSPSSRSGGCQAGRRRKMVLHSDAEGLAGQTDPTKRVTCPLLLLPMLPWSRKCGRGNFVTVVSGISVHLLCLNRPLWGAKEREAWGICF